MTRSSNGLFVSVDGPSGVGKSTTVRALAQLLRGEGRIVHETAEPSDGPIGQLARELTETVHGLALACVYAADRYHHLTEEVLQHLEAGEAVITDRYIPSALVMQQLDGVDPDYLWRINARASKPHLAVLLDADPSWWPNACGTGDHTTDSSGCRPRRISSGTTTARYTSAWSTLDGRFSGLTAQTPPWQRSPAWCRTGYRTRKRLSLEANSGVSRDHTES